MPNAYSFKAIWYYNKHFIFKHIFCCKTFLFVMGQYASWLLLSRNLDTLASDLCLSYCALQDTMPRVLLEVKKCFYSGVLMMCSKSSVCRLLWSKN